MRIFNFLKKNNDFYSQSGQDQFAYNLSGLNGFYLEIGAHHPIINSNTFKLEKDCNWKGLSIEYDKSYKDDWDKCIDRKNEVIWDDAFNIDFSLLAQQKNFPNKINYLSCDIEPASNTFKILKKIIKSGISFDYISFEHDKYNEGNIYEKLALEFLSKNDYKVAIKDVYSRNKKQKIYETWFVNNKTNFIEVNYSEWRKTFYKNEMFSM
tara:strand:+ start:1158 stop:1784 length:627 start_codon:yes stop_codon:yes gene_type:complete